MTWSTQRARTERLFPSVAYAIVGSAAWAEYEKVRDAAYAEMVVKLSKVLGYVPA